MFIGDTSACTKASGLPFVATAKILDIRAFSHSGIIATRFGLTAIRSRCVRIADELAWPRIPIGI